MHPAQVPKVGRVRTKDCRAAEEAVALEKFEEGGGFAAGDDESVDAVELLGLADEDRFGTGFAQGGGVGFVVALDGENADFGYVDR